MHQLLSIEAQSEYAALTRDLNLAEAVIVRVEELTEGDVLEAYDEVVPGTRDRLLAAHARVAGLLE